LTSKKGRSAQRHGTIPTENRENSQTSTAKGQSSNSPSTVYQKKDLRRNLPKTARTSGGKRTEKKTPKNSTPLSERTPVASLIGPRKKGGGIQMFEKTPQTQKRKKKKKGL